MSTGREGGDIREERDGREGFRWILDPESRIHDPPATGFLATGSRVQDLDPDPDSELGADLCSSHLATCFILAGVSLVTFHPFLNLSIFVNFQFHSSPILSLPQLIPLWDTTLSHIRCLKSQTHSLF